MFDLILKNGTLVNEDKIFESDIAIKGNRIEKIAASIDAESKNVIDLNGKLISKPIDRKDALRILKLLNGNKHYLISSICLSMNGAMIWNYTDKAALTMKDLSDKELREYLSKITDEALYAYNVYQIEGIGKSLFSEIKGDSDTIIIENVGVATVGFSTAFQFPSVLDAQTKCRGTLCKGRSVGIDLWYPRHCLQRAMSQI